MKIVVPNFILFLDLMTVVLMKPDISHATQKKNGIEIY